MNHDAFLQAILDAPDDDTPRLVYADWLDDHGEPDHALFIRTQCQLATLADDDPRRRLPEAEEARVEAGLRGALGEKKRPFWAARVPAWALRESWRFERGMIGQISTTAVRYLHGAEALHRAAPIRYLGLRNVTPYLGVFECRELQRVRALDLRGNKLATTGARALCESPQVRDLKELHLSGCRLRIAEARALATNPRLATLEKLALGHNQLHDAGPEAIVESEHLTRLRELELERTQVGPRGAAALGRSTTLTRLGLGSNRLGDDGVRRLMGAGGLNQLTHLHLGRNAIHQAAGELLTSDALPSLEHLDLSGNRIEADLLALTPSSLRRGRLQLSLTGLLNVTANDVVQSPLVAACVGLQWGPYPYQAGLTGALVRAPVVANLRWLELSGHDVEPNTLAVLGHSPHLGNLQELRLQTWTWTEALSQALVAMPLLRRLKSLSVRALYVRQPTHSFLQHAGAFAHLERLTCSSNFAWSEAMAPSREALGHRLRLM